MQQKRKFSTFTSLIFDFIWDNLSRILFNRSVFLSDIVSYFFWISWKIKSLCLFIDLSFCLSLSVVLTRGTSILVSDFIFLNLPAPTTTAKSLNSPPPLPPPYHYHHFQHNHHNHYHHLQHNHHSHCLTDVTSTPSLTPPPTWKARHSMAVTEEAAIFVDCSLVHEVFSSWILKKKKRNLRHHKESGWKEDAERRQLLLATLLFLH